MCCQHDHHQQSAESTETDCICPIKYLKKSKWAPNQCSDLKSLRSCPPSTEQSLFLQQLSHRHLHFGKAVQMSQPDWWVRLQTDYKELPRNYLSQGAGPNLASRSFQEQTCEDKTKPEKRKCSRQHHWKERKKEGKNSINILLGLWFSKGLISNKHWVGVVEGKSFFTADLCILTLTKQAAERRVCGVIGVPLGIMAGRGNPVLLRTTGWGRKTFGAVTAIQLCRREGNTFTCKPTSGINDSVNISYKILLQKFKTTQNPHQHHSLHLYILFPIGIKKNPKNKPRSASWTSFGWM